ncbi:hypothetical protein ACFFX0_15370 [Citricoccus parietis]|uniref:Uncharacterized protein n=1 Tax=Citricoccus parietis TaxID=592307 RepID=A0ABV5G0P8_9MICC
MTPGSSWSSSVTLATQWLQVMPLILMSVVVVMVILRGVVMSCGAAGGEPVSA